MSTARGRLEAATPSPSAHGERVVELPVRREPAALREPGAELERRVGRSFWLTVGAANLIGAIVVFVFLGYVVPSPTPARGSVTTINLLVFVPFMAVTMTAGAVISRRVWAPIKRWLVEDRLPDANELDLTLRHPLRQSLCEAGMWGGAALTFGVLNAFFDVGLGAEVAIVILLAGELTSAISYLLIERAIRPVTARALAAGPPKRPALPGVRTRLVLAWSFSTGVLLTLLALVAVTVLAGTPASTDRLAATVLFVSVVGFAAGLATVTIAARSVAEPVEAVRSALAEVEGGNTAVEAPVNDGSEIGLLQAGFNRMVVGLRERELLRDLFGRHVGEDVARQALQRGLKLGGEVREVAVLFVDLIGSTTLAETRDPSSVLTTLNEFFGIVVEEVSLHGGWVNKFEGDAALCVFGAPTAHPDAAGSALATARALCDRLEREIPDTPAGIGLSAGQVVAGNVGTAERFEYTVIGDPVNEAARLTDLAKTAPGRLLASQAILERAGAPERGHWRTDETVTLRGRNRPTSVARPV